MANSSLKRLLFILSCTALIFIRAADAADQTLQPASFSLDRGILGLGECYTIIVQNAANTTLDVQYAFNNGGPQTIEGWPKLDANGRASVCTNATTRLGIYTFLAMRRSGDPDWIPVQASIMVAPPQQPSFLSITPNVVSQGSCFVVVTGNGGSMTLDVQYKLNDGPVQTIRGWPKLEGTGRSYICADNDTAMGNYSFVAFRNSVTDAWVPASTSVLVASSQPDIPPGLMKETLGDLMKRTTATYGSQLVSGEIRDSVSEGTVSLYAILPTTLKATFPVTLFRKGNRKVQEIINEGTFDQAIGTDGINSWNAGPLGISPVSGSILRLIESQTSRSIERLLNYQSERLALRDMGINGNSRVIEAEDPDGKRTLYFIDVTTSRVVRMEIAAGESKDPFSGQPTTDVERFILSDFRGLQGTPLAPFKIERFINGEKFEETQFGAVRYNTGIPDDVFQPSFRP